MRRRVLALLEALQLEGRSIALEAEMFDIVYSLENSNDCLQERGIMEIVEQFQAEDGCVHFYDEKRGTWMKVCNVSANDLPLSVKNRVREEQSKAERVLNLPLK